jgi:hypothetical protein
MQRTLLGAYRRYSGGENRLTELFAVALESYLPFARAVVADAFHEDDTESLGIDTDRIEQVVVRGQVPADGRLVDMEIRALDADGSTVAVIWFENKIDAEYQRNQLGDYHRCLEVRYSVPRRLVTIVKHASHALPEAREFDVPVFTWAQIGAIADRAVRDATGEEKWRASALEPTAEAQLRIIEEFIRYLEEQVDVILKPVLAENIQAFQLANETFEQLWALLDRAGKLAAAQDAHLGEASVTDSWKQSWGRYECAFTGGPSWVHDAAGRNHMVAFDSDDWMPEPEDKPVIGVGASFDSNVLERERLLVVDWRSALEKDGFIIGESVLGDDHWHRIYRRIYFDQILHHGSTLDDQANWLAQQATDAFAALQRHQIDLTGPISA